MRGLGNTKLWHHSTNSFDQRSTNSEIRKSQPLLVNSFKELVPIVARIANHNADHSLFFRGQSKDYLLANGESSVYPNIFRKQGRSLEKSLLNKRYEKLRLCSELLLEKVHHLEGLDKLKKFPELQWSILQHYHVCPTPLLDVTHSLRVAASFASIDSRKNGVILVFALPHPQGTITYYTEEEMLNIRLLSASPYEALRPHFQEGYLVGTFPSRTDMKHPSLDLSLIHI